MNKAPERIWVCSHVGEYGRFFPEAVEAEGEYGGNAVEYARADRIEELEIIAQVKSAQVEITFDKLKIAL